MIPQGPFSPFHQQRWIEAYNGGSATIPAFGCAEVTASTRPDTASVETPSGGRTVLTIQQPTVDSAPNFVINSALPIAAGKYGLVTKDYPTFVAYTGSTPASGETWGPASGTCLIASGKSGLIIDGDADGTIVRATRTYASPEQSRFYYNLAFTGVSTTEISLSLSLQGGQLTGSTVSGLGANPSGYTKIFRADSAMNIWMNFSSYVSKDTAAAGVANCFVYIKKWSAANALVDTRTGYCDVPTLSAVTAGMTMAFQAHYVMTAGQYLTCTTVFGGGYTSTLAHNYAGLIIRPIQT